MRKEQEMRGFHLKKFHKTALILFAAIIITVGISGTIAKYITTDTRKGSVMFTATLAERVELIENAAERQIDGSYAITEGEVQGNSYLAMLFLRNIFGISFSVREFSV